MQPRYDIDRLTAPFLLRAKSVPGIRVAVVHPCSSDALAGAVDAAREGLIEPVLVGPRIRIEALARELALDITGFELMDVLHSHAAAEAAVGLARSGSVAALMKGSLHTDELMGEVIKRENGLRTERRISHVFLMADDNYHKPFVITDAAMNIAPDLAAKRDIVQNAIDFLINIHEEPIIPKVAVLTAVETVNPAMQSTIDAACLSKMAERGQITGAIIDGPLAFDNAISLEAAEIKGIRSPVSGDADIFLVPDLEAGNMLAKQLVLLGGASTAGLILGARLPIILNSRSDSRQSRIESCALAVLVTEAERRKRFDLGEGR